jgi:hypothetical protein
VSVAKRHKRRPDIAPTAGLVVEGDTEFKALPYLHTKKLIPKCPPLRAKNLGGVGSDLLPVGIAARLVGPVIAHQVSGHHPIIACIDREQRQMSAASLAGNVATELRRLLEERNRSTAGVFVAVADRTFEAWLLADAHGLHKRGHLKHAPSFRSFEGLLGRERKKGVVELSILLDRPYGKTTDGPALFEALDFPTARAGSASLHAFLSTLGV